MPSVHLDEVLVGLLGTLVPKDKEACGSCFQKPYPSTDLALLVKASLCVTSQLSSSSFAKGFLLGQPRTVKLKSRLEKSFGKLTKNGLRAITFGKL